MEINRRELIVNTGVLAAASAASAAFGQESPAKTWYDRPMRWAQLAFVEDDPGHYKPSFWLDYYKRDSRRRGLPQRGRMRGLLSD